MGGERVKILSPLLMVNKIFKLLLLISPIAYTTGMKPEKFELIFFHFGVMALYIASLFDIPKRTRSIPIGVTAILSLCVVSTIIHSFQMASLGVLLNLFIFYIGLGIVINHLDGHKSYYKYISWAVIINCAVWLIQNYIINFLPFVTYESGSFFGSAPRLFSYLSILIPILYSVTPLFLFIPLLAIIGKEYSSILISAMVLFGTFKSIKIKGLIISGLGLFSIIFLKNIIKSFDLRFKEVFPPAIMEAAKTPFIGHGLGAYYNQMGSDSFNILLLIWYDLGLIGVIVVGYAIWELRKLFKLNVATMSIVAILAVSMFDGVLEIPRIWFTLIFMVCVFLLQKENGENVCEKY